MRHVLAREVTHTAPALASPCPHCDRVLDAMTGRAWCPRPGDLTVCASCRGIGQFANGLVLERVDAASLTADIHDQLAAWQRVLVAITTD